MTRSGRLKTVSVLGAYWISCINSFWNTTLPGVVATFKLGVNVATTPGKVVFQNELMQLIQYAPSTETVFKRPLLVIPPWINKYYILDLREKNSFVRWALGE